MIGMLELLIKSHFRYIRTQAAQIDDDGVVVDDNVHVDEGVNDDDDGNDQDVDEDVDIYIMAVCVFAR